MKYAISLQYNGTDYHGWQVQNESITVQQLVEEGLGKFLREEVRVHGCGRTDTGVHASMYIAHFETNEQPDTAAWKFKLNNILPRDVAVMDIVPVYGDFHARFTALSRSYHYIISRERDAFIHPFAAYYNEEFDISLMNAAADILLQHTDFASFCKAGGQSQTTLCKVEHAHWHEYGSLLVFEISADRFLRNMVRAVVGTMLEVGRGKLSLPEFEKVIESKDRSAAGFSAPACGLHLSHVEYPTAYLRDTKSRTNSLLNV